MLENVSFWLFLHKQHQVTLYPQAEQECSGLVEPEPVASVTCPHATRTDYRSVLILLSAYLSTPESHAEPV